MLPIYSPRVFSILIIIDLNSCLIVLISGRSLGLVALSFDSGCYIFLLHAGHDVQNSRVNKYYLCLQIGISHLLLGFETIWPEIQLVSILLLLQDLARVLPLILLCV